jgi:ATP-dependent RNA helicase DDX21
MFSFLSGAVDDKEQVQTLLFSATMPDWVREISKRFLKDNRKTVDLVGNETMKASKSVQHLLLPCHWTQVRTEPLPKDRSMGIFY